MFTGEALKPDDCSDATPLMSAPVSLDIKRISTDIAAPLTMLAAAAKEIDLVDPFFDLRGKSGDYKGPLVATLAGLAALSVFPKAFRIHFRTHDSRPPTDHLARESADLLSGAIPPGFTIELCEWEQIPGGEDLHDRFFLTDVGGVIIGAGFAATGDAETVTFSLLDIEHTQRLRSRFAAGSTVYRQIGQTVRINSDGKTEITS